MLKTWQLLLADQDAQEVARAVAYLIQTSNATFAPSVSQVFGAMHELRSPTETADEAWAMGPRKESSERAKAAWKLWGGATRWRMLPDMKQAQFATSMQNYSFARKEFLEIYHSAVDKARKEPERLSHAKAKAVLESVGYPTNANALESQ